MISYAFQTSMEPIAPFIHGILEHSYWQIVGTFFIFTHISSISS